MYSANTDKRFQMWWQCSKREKFKTSRRWSAGRKLSLTFLWKNRKACQILLQKWRFALILLTSTFTTCPAMQTMSQQFGVSTT